MQLKEKYVTDEKGNRIGVILDIADYEKLLEELEELEELDAIRAYDTAKLSDEEEIPFEQALTPRCFVTVYFLDSSALVKRYVPEVAIKILSIPMTATLIQSPDRVILPNISWQTYQSLIKDFEQEPAIRLTYDRGALEIRMPLDPHETYKKLLGRLVEAATEELDIEIRSLGSRTCDREDLARGLEPDQCYYIQNEALVRGVDQIDLNQFPPPDLALEIDITSSSINRLSIYAALRVPEVWRYDGQNLTILSLQNGEYVSQDRSAALPFLKAEDILRFLALRNTMGETSLVKQFRQWVKETVAE